MVEFREICNKTFEINPILKEKIVDSSKAFRIINFNN